MNRIEKALANATQTRALRLGRGVADGVATVFKEQFGERRALVVAQRDEAQGEIVVVAVGGNARVLARHALAHLEGRCQVLCIAYHRNGNVADKDGTHDGILLLLMHTLERSTYAVGYAPSVYDSVDFESLTLLYGPNVGIDFLTGLAEALAIYDYGKSMPCLTFEGE